jgi:hypothetical protein
VHGLPDALSNEIHYYKMQNDIGEDEIRERSFRRDTLELDFVPWVGLHSQTHSQHKRSNARDEPRQE